MIKMLGNIPERLGVAVSGGVDSMVLLDFLIKGGRDVTIFHYHHGDNDDTKAFDFVTDVADSLQVPMVHSHLSEPIPQNRSTEEFWRESRYKFLDGTTYDAPICLGHHLDDVVETWLFSSFHGTPKIIPYNRKNCIRPMLMVKKQEILDWAKRNSVPYIDDPSNTNVGFMRNKIRHDIVPNVLEVNPGIHKVLAKKVQMQYDNYSTKGAT